MFKTFFITLSIFLSTIIILFTGFKSPSDKFSFPIRTHYTKTSNYGYRVLNTYHFHNGIDLAAPVGTDLYAISSGTVIYTGFYGSYGNVIIISYYNGYKSIYGHVSSSFIVEVGDSVDSNSIVGSIGPKYLKNGKLNGNTTGPHLHFSVFKNGKTIDPSKLYKKDK